MKKWIVGTIIFLGLALVGLAEPHRFFFANQVESKQAEIEIGEDKSMTNQDINQTAEIYLAGGCFWGTEYYLQQAQGVLTVESGYANGKTENPTYAEVCNGSGHAETVRVTYDPQKISLRFLLKLFFKSIDPTSKNRQGNDVGAQYRTGIYYTQISALPIIEAALAELQKEYTQPLAIEVKALENFYIAEDYHQDYLIKNPNGYCHIGKKLIEEAGRITPDAQAIYEKLDDLTLKKILSPEQYAVTRKNGTEPPFKNDYWDFFEEGIYVDITTGEPLFSSRDKFKSECGWPAFAKPLDEALMAEKIDHSFGMTRTEARSKIGDAHLGHIFPDGPEELGGLRYCINSASLRFIPKEEMVAAGYGKYLSLFDKP